MLNSSHIQTPKAEETPLATPLPPNPSAGRAAGGGRGEAASELQLLELSGCSGNFFRPPGLYLEASSFSSLFFRTSSACLSWEGRERRGQVTQGSKGTKTHKGQKKQGVRPLEVDQSKESGHRK